MQQRLSSNAWKQAAQHHHGKGAENGVDMTVLRRHHKQLLTRGAHTRAGMLYKLATARIYDGTRVCEHNAAEAAQIACVPCGSPDDSMFHRAYDFPCLPPSAVLDTTEQIVEEARELAHSCPVFWFRGPPPSDWYPELPITEDPFAEGFGSLNIIGVHVFTDGSGGTQTKDPRLRRCGHGEAWVLANSGTHNTLGKTQSVAREELLAAAVAQQLCAKATQQVIIWSDCMFVLNVSARGRRRKHLSHADLWKDFWNAYDAVGSPVLVHKVWKSHVTEVEIAAGPTLTKNISSCQIKNYFAALMNIWSNVLRLNLVCLRTP